MGYFTNLSIGLNRAYRIAPGPFADWGSKRGVGRRVGAGIIKAASLGATSLAPLGIRLELIQRRLVAPSNSSPEQLRIAREFLQAFADPEARRLARQTMIEGNAGAIMRHHPQAEGLAGEQVHRQCQILVETVFRRLTDLATSPAMLFDVVVSMSGKAEPAEKFWFPEYREANLVYRQRNRARTFGELLSPYILGTSLVDIGCGNGSQALYLREQLKLTRVGGIDVVDWREPTSDVEFHRLDLSVPGASCPESYDTGILIHVLHHVGGEEKQLAGFLRGTKAAVRRRVIVLEEALATREELRSFLKLGELNRMEGTQPCLSEYLDCGPQTQKKANIIRDLLAGILAMGVPEMPFPFGFRPLKSWINLFERQGFRISEIKILGFQASRFHPGFDVLFVLDV